MHTYPGTTVIQEGVQKSPKNAISCHIVVCFGLISKFNQVSNLLDIHLVTMLIHKLWHILKLNMLHVMQVYQSEIIPQYNMYISLTESIKSTALSPRLNSQV